MRQGLPWFQSTDPGDLPQHFLIAGPCVLEMAELHDEIAEVLLKVQEECDIPVVFKGSFDKANRCKGTSPRGPGLVEGLRLLHDVQERHGLAVMTDIHEAWQASVVAQVVDAIQIPAALCRQTDLLAAAAETRLPLNLKKGQWVGVAEMEGAVAKLRVSAFEEDGRQEVVVTERGNFFGYGDVVVDMRNIWRLRTACKVPVVFDATHTVQQPGRGGSGGSLGVPQDIEPLARAAAAAGSTGLFIEVHPRPAKAPSDGSCMLVLDRLLPLMRVVTAIWAVDALASMQHE